MSKNLNVVIPMAGDGARFAKAGYALPKPFIEVLGKPMIRWVMDNLKFRNASYTLIGRQPHLDAAPEAIEELGHAYGAEIIGLPQLTEGTVCTLLWARSLINNDAPLLIANADQVVDFDLQDFIDDAERRRLDGSILTFIDPKRNPKCSYALPGKDGMVIEVAEKNPISDHATVGIYWFRRGSDFINAAIDMIARNDRVNGEFYTCPTYNYALANGLKIGFYDIPAECIHLLGIPEDMEAFFAWQKTNASSARRA